MSLQIDNNADDKQINMGNTEGNGTESVLNINYNDN